MADKHWYIVQAYSNFERKVADSIREQAKQRHLEHLFDQVMVPTEKVVEVRRGQKVPTTSPSRSRRPKPPAS
jgi:transcriptional antiterminator NusG